MIKNPIPGMSKKKMKEVYKNRKANGLEKRSWKCFKEKYEKMDNEV